MSYEEIRETLAADVRAGQCPLDEAAIAQRLASRDTAGLDLSAAREMANRFMQDVARETRRGQSKSG